MKLCNWQNKNNLISFQVVKYWTKCFTYIDDVISAFYPQREEALIVESKRPS